MDVGVVVGMLGAAVAAVFGAWNLNIQRQFTTLDRYAETWKTFYEKECEKHDKTRQASAEDLRELTGAVKDLTRVVEQVPKRREDWTPEPTQRNPG